MNEWVPVKYPLKWPPGWLALIYGNWEFLRFQAKLHLRGPFYWHGLIVIRTLINNYTSYSVGWNYLSIPKLQCCSCWSLEITKSLSHLFNTLRPRQNGLHFADDIFKYIFLNWQVWISLKIWYECVSKVRINNIAALVQIMALRRPSDKPLSEPMMV